MDRLFAFRHRRIASDLGRHLAIGRGRRLRIVLTGRTGWVLTQLAAFLGTGGHVVRLFPTSEDPRTQPSEAAWGPTLVPDFAALEQADAVIHMGLGDLSGLLTRARRARQPRAHRHRAADPGAAQRRAGDHGGAGGGHRADRRAASPCC